MVIKGMVSIIRDERDVFELMIMIIIVIIKMECVQ